MHNELFTNLKQDKQLTKSFKHTDTLFLNGLEFTNKSLIKHANFILKQLDNTSVLQSKLIEETQQFF